MAETDVSGVDPGFELIALPSPTTVRDPDTNEIVNGYDLRVRSTKSGAIATLEIPTSRYSAAYIAQLAKAALAPLDESIATFGASTLTGSRPASSG